jgi:hypothetical protein
MTFKPYSFLAEAAAEARVQSRRYWAKGGEADRKYPVQKIKYWKTITVDDREARLEASLRRMGRR